MASFTNPRAPLTSSACEVLITHRVVALLVARAEASGTVTAFRQSKFKQDSYQTIVDLVKPEEAADLLGARVVWAGKDGLKILGRVVALHGSKGALRVRWDRGFPPQALGTQVTILP